MRNKSFLWIFVILLTLTVVYVLSFGYVAKSYEKKIGQLTTDSLNSAGVNFEVGDSIYSALYKKTLRDSSDAKAYPLFGHSYNQLKEQELNLGLDLKGGMSVVLEVSIPDLFIALSDNNSNPVFAKSIADARAAQRSSTSSFVDLFYDAWKSNNTTGLEMWRIFDTMENKGKFPAKSSDDDVVAILRKESDDALNNTENIIKKRIEPFGVTQANVQRQSISGRIIVELPGVDDVERVRKVLKATANLEFWDTYRTDEVFMKMYEVYGSIGKKLAPDLYSQDPNRAQKDSLMMVALKDTSLTKIQQDSIRVAYRDTTVRPDSLLTEKELSRKYPLRKLQLNPQSGSAVIGFAQVSDTSDINRYINMEEAKSVLPADLRLLWAAKPEGNIVALYGIKDKSMRGKAELDGKSITDARQDFNMMNGEVEVNMSMDTEGASIWREMTRKNAADNNRPIAIVMDNLVFSAPNVNGEIPNGSSVIQFGKSTGTNETKLQQEAKDLAGLLKAGSLPAPAKIIDEVTVGPSVGEENITAGLWSFIIAFVLILIYMVFYYAWAGWAANVALIANLFFMIGALVSIGASLTLPGIAGIVLSMGMAVDANVIIYERVKEELRLGKGISSAMNDGFLKAMSAILDGNATTLITGIILLLVGTGPIKGFATTLIIGIFTTLFTAFIISRLILYRRLENKKTITFYSNLTKNWFTNFNYDFVGKRKKFYILSLVIVGLGIASWVTRGFNMGVEFAGGTSARVNFAQTVNPDDVRSALGATLIQEDGKPASYIVQSIGGGNKDFKVTTNYLIDSENENVENMVSAKLNESFAKMGTSFEIGASYKVDPTMSDDFRRQAIWAGLLALILVGAYILIRFRKWDFALGASVALFHDAIVVVAAFTIFNGILPFTLEVNQNFIGAILTVIGYSINDTVVIFDRIREYLKVRKNDPIEGTINDALNSTMGRSINTSMTVLITLLVMFIFGSDDIKGFCFAMIVGVISGVYSTLFIATPIVVDMRKLLGKKEEAAEEKRAAAAVTA
jgi:SecD/SecF fusion protein